VDSRVRNRRIPPVEDEEEGAGKPKHEYKFPTNVAVLLLELPFLNTNECYNWKKFLDKQSNVVTLDLWLGELSSVEALSGVLTSSVGTLRNLTLVLPANDIYWVAKDKAKVWNGRDPLFNWNWLAGASLQQLNLTRSNWVFATRTVESIGFPSVDLSQLENLDLRGIRMAPGDIIRILEETPNSLRSLNLMFWTQIEQLNLSNEEILSWGARLYELSIWKTGLGFLGDDSYNLSDWLVLKYHDLAGDVQDGNDNIVDNNVAEE
jgi:hypothetical protein